MTSKTMRDPVDVLAELLTPQAKVDPYALYEELWAHGPVIDLGGQVVVLGYEECARALREPRLLSMDADVQDELRPGWREHSAWRGLTQIMLFRNPPAHDRLRRTFSPFFTQSAVAAMRPVVERVARADVERLAEMAAGGTAVDLLDELAFRYPMNVLGELLGIPEADRPRFRTPVGDLAATYEPTMQLDDLGAADAAMDFMYGYLSDLVAARQREPGDDLTSSLVRAQAAAGDVSDDDLVLNIMLVIVGGTEAPMDLLAKAVKLAVDDAGHRELLRRGDPDEVSGFVEETLRYEPAVHALVRLAGADVELPGLSVAEGTRLTLIIAAANRDPRRYREPNRFDPHRSDNQHLTFSAGGHFCLGAALARSMAEALLPALFRRLPDLRLAGPPTYRDTIIQHGFATFPVAAG